LAKIRPTIIANKIPNFKTYTSLREPGAPQSHVQARQDMVLWWPMYHVLRSVTAAESVPGVSSTGGVSRVQRLVV
jgi:hypothetical protein